MSNLIRCGCLAAILAGLANTAVAQTPFPPPFGCAPAAPMVGCDPCQPIAPAHYCGPPVTAPMCVPINGCLPQQNCVDPCVDPCVDSCGTMGCAEDCCACLCDHRTRIFGEFLLLSAGNVDFRYAVPVNGTAATAAPIGRGGLVQPNHSPGFRVGGAIAFSDRSSVVATFTNYSSSATSSLILPGGTGFIRALTVHPNTLSVDTDSLEARARYEIDFLHADIDYQRRIAAECKWIVNGRFGLRYAQLDEDFRGDYLINGETTVRSRVDFSGVGPRVGLDFEGMLSRCFKVYARSSTSFVFGDFAGDFSQTHILDGVQAADGFDDYRLVPILEMEAGFGYRSCSGKWNITAGYFWSAWFNSMTTAGLVDAVGSANYDQVDETLLFDGLTARLELRF